MAVPASGPISLLGIFSEKNESDYSAFGQDGEDSFSLLGLSDDSEDDSLSLGQINLNPRNPSSKRPNQSAPHAMSEFYGYDHDEASIAGYLVDDFQGTPTSTRANFNSTTLGDSLTAGDADGDANGNSTSIRPLWTTLGGGTSHVSNDYIKMSNTTDSNHSQWRTTQVDKRDGVSAASISVGSVQFCWEFRFYIDGNKDLRFFLEAGSSLSTTWNTGGTNWKGYAFTFDDDSTRNIRWQKFTQSGTPTTVTTTSNDAFTLDAYNVCKITRFTSTRWKVDIDGTTVINGVTDSDNYTQFYGYRFWTAKNGSGVDNRIDYFKTYTE